MAIATMCAAAQPNPCTHNTTNAVRPGIARPSRLMSLSGKTSVISSPTQSGLLMPWSVRMGATGSPRNSKLAQKHYGRAKGASRINSSV